jgi:spore coat protein F
MVGKMRDDNAFYAGDLLGLAKKSFRSYAISITETATRKCEMF